jgi:hypothetical protein
MAMRCPACGETSSREDRFCGSCGGALPPSCTQCGSIVSPDDEFCGSCGALLKATDESSAIAETHERELFPLYGVTLGKTTVQELARLGERTRSVDKATGLPYQSYSIHRTDFWYSKAGVASDLYIAKGVSSIPEPWSAIGFDWDLSYDEWVSLLRQLGYSITVEEPPRVAAYDGHDSFSARVVAEKPARPLITLDFNYNKGANTASKGTVYSISAKAR